MAKLNIDIIRALSAEDIKRLELMESDLFSMLIKVKSTGEYEQVGNNIRSVWCDVFSLVYGTEVNNEE